MFKYYATSMALKLASLNNTTKSIYRYLGNTVGQKQRKRRSVLQYIERGNLLLELWDRYQVLGNPGSSCLELGTGWTHWYSLYPSLFADTKSTMYDVWDNRQFDALQVSFAKLAQHLQSTGTATSTAKQRLTLIQEAKSFQDLYDKLNLTYIIEPEGHLDGFRDAEFDCVYSFHVMEHIPRNVVMSSTIPNMHRILKPGGFSIHQIGIDDHHTHYDKTMSPKNYLRYSDQTWNRFFDNDVQHINRIQMPEWLAQFEAMGFELRERIVESCNIDSLSIHPQFRDFSQEDLECTILTLVHQKT